MDLLDFNWTTIITEMKDRLPDVLDFIVTVAIPKSVHDDGRQVAPVAAFYAIMMNLRWRELRLVQKLITMVLGVGHATSKVI